MTEAEWLASADPAVLQMQNLPFGVHDLFEHLHVMPKLSRTKRGKRKIRLFACAGCRRWWPRLPEQTRQAVELAEQFADGQATRQQRFDGFRSLYRPPTGRHRDFADLGISVLDAHDWYAAFSVSSHSYGLVCEWVRESVAARITIANDVYGEEIFQQIRLLHDIFGNPFRPARIDPAWLAWNHGTVRLLAEAIYAERAFERMPILADALEEAGCGDADLLHHCRQSDAVHVRGCWVVDLLTGRA
jgi:hypothetical protein